MPAIMHALPLGSTVTNWPGTSRRQPLLPKSSWCTFLKAALSLSHCSTTMRPESEPTMRWSVWAPVMRKGVTARMAPNTSQDQTTTSLPTSLGRSSSSTLPCDTTISWALGPEKLP